MFLFYIKNIYEFLRYSVDLPFHDIKIRHKQLGNGIEQWVWKIFPMSNYLWLIQSVSHNQNSNKKYIVTHPYIFGCIVYNTHGDFKVSIQKRP